MDNKIIKKINKEIRYLNKVIDVLEEENEELEYENEELDEQNIILQKELDDKADLLRNCFGKIIAKNKLIKELENELQDVKSENIRLKEENRKNSGKINADWIKTGSKSCSEALKFEESMDKLREFLESDTEKCDNGYITDYPNFQELIDKDRLKDLASKKLEDRTMDDCIEECLIKLRLGQDKHKGELFEIDLTRYFYLLDEYKKERDYLTDSIVNEGYDKVLLNIEIDYRLEHKVTLKVRIPE